jgi:hypothetical protein
MATAQNELINFELTQHLRSAFRSATIGIVSAKGNDMAKKQAAKKTDPFDLSADFVEGAFQEAVGEVWEQQRRDGLDSYGTIDGKPVVVRPDGRIEPAVLAPKKTNG